MPIISIVLYAIALILFFYIIYKIVKTGRLRLNTSDAIAILGIVIAIILGIGIYPQPPRIIDPTTPTPMPQTNVMIYDNFDNPAFDGSFDQNQWRYVNNPSNQIVQKDGVLIVTRNSGPLGEGLAPHSYYFVTLDYPTFFEAELLQSPDENLGDVGIGVYAHTSPGNENFWFSKCNIDTGWAHCGDTVWPPRQAQGENYDVGGKYVDYGTWHRFRIEIMPDSMAFTYYIDDKVVGSHVPIDAEKLKKALLVFTIGVYGEKTTGHFDNVKIGPIEK